MTVAVLNDKELEAVKQAVVHGLCRRAGVPVSNEHELTPEFASLRLPDLARRFVETHGVSTGGIPGPTLSRALFNSHIAAATGVPGHATASFPLLLQDAMNKALGQGYQESPASWQQWMRRRTAPDFKAIHTVRFGEFPDLDEVREGAEYQYVTIGEEREHFTLANYGKFFDVTWETIINDDLDALMRVPRMMGAAARRLENETAYLPFIGAANGETMSDSVALFNSSHGNLAGTPAALDVDSLGAARAAMRTQTGITSGVKINVTPRFLIVPAGLEATAQQLMRSIADPDAAHAGVVNPFRGSLELVVEPLLDSDVEFPGSSDTAWYLAAASAQIDTLEVAFLQGDEQPWIDAMNYSNVDGRRWKVRHCVAAKAIDWRGVYKNAGA